MKPFTLKIVSLFVLTALLSSCNTGNKLASSFEKRKYTKGYYFDKVEPQSPIISSDAIIKSINNKPLIQSPGNSANTRMKSVMVITGSNMLRAYCKTHRVISAPQQKTPFKQAIENTLLHFPNVLSAATPTDTDKDSDNKSKDTAALLGLIFGAASILIILISLALTAGTGIYLGALLLSMCLGIAGLSKGIEGLKSEKNKGLAFAGIILGSVTLIVAIVLFALALKNNML